MTQSLLVCLLLLLHILSEAQGIRLDNGFVRVGQRKIYKEEAAKTSRKDGGVEEVILCQEGHCSGKHRKLIMTKSTTSTSTITTTSKNMKNGAGFKAETQLTGKTSSEGLMGGKEEKSSVNTLQPVFEYPERYPDSIDLAGMDYSPAKRKPPIHN